MAAAIATESSVHSENSRELPEDVVLRSFMHLSLLDIHCSTLGATSARLRTSLHQSSEVLRSSRGLDDSGWLCVLGGLRDGAACLESTAAAEV